jgi:hypothetical protein
MAVPCPWGVEEIDLHDKILSKPEKDWIAGEIISKKECMLDTISACVD